MAISAPRPLGEDISAAAACRQSPLPQSIHLPLPGSPSVVSSPPRVPAYRECKTVTGSRSDAFLISDPVKGSGCRSRRAPHGHDAKSALRDAEAHTLGVRTAEPACSARTLKSGSESASCPRMALACSTLFSIRPLLARRIVIEPSRFCTEILTTFQRGARASLLSFVCHSGRRPSA